MTIVNPPKNGSATLNSDFTIDYTPDNNFNGWDTLTYELCDKYKHCDTANVYVRVGCVEILRAGADATVCEDQNSYTLSNADTSSISGSLQWSRTSNNAGGGGSFSDPTALNPTYNFSNDDINNGSVELELNAPSASCTPPDTIPLHPLHPSAPLDYSYTARLP